MTTEIQLPAAELKQALPGFNKIIGKSTLPIFRSIRIVKTSTAPAYLQAANLGEFATLTLQSALSLRPVDVIVPVEALTKVTKACSPSDTIRIVQQGDQTKLVYPIANNLVDLGVPSVDLDEWPHVPTIDQDSITVGDGFKSAIKAALDCSSEDESRPVLQSTFLDVSVGPQNGQSHILTLSLSPPPRRQQIRQTRSRPHLQPGGNPLQRHLPAGRQVVVSARNFTASFNFDLSPFFRAARAASLHPSLASPSRTSRSAFSVALSCNSPP